MTIARRFLLTLFALLIAAPAFAQAPRMYSQPELDRMLAPVALYPDPLLSQVLMAATYPAEVVEAAQWSRAHPGLHGDDAVRAAADQDWDPSVKSLLAFPELLARMDENLEWTQSLGDAFLGQETQVMDTVQQLRRRAYAQGNLRSDERIHVQPQGEVIIIVPSAPEVVYLPYYDPLVVYGDWWWPDYRPVYWAPWRGYARYHHFWWGSPIRLSVGFFFGGFDWRHRHVHVSHVRNYYIRADRYPNFRAGRWNHDAYRRVESRQRIEQRADRREMRERLERVEQRTERRQEARQERRDDRRDTSPDRREQLREQFRQRTQETRPEQRREDRQDWREQRREQLREQIRERAQEQRQEPRVERREQIRERAQEIRPERREERQDWREQRREQAPREQFREQAREQFRERRLEQQRERPQVVQPRQEAPRVQQERPQVQREMPRPQVQSTPRQEAPRVQERQERREARQEARQERREERRERGRGS